MEYTSRIVYTTSIYIKFKINESHNKQINLSTAATAAANDEGNENKKEIIINFSF